MSTTPWILTAFEPFAGRPRNASAVILKQVRDDRIATRMLPVVFDALADEISAALSLRPRVLILMGETGARRNVRVERIALNILDAQRRPDNCGRVVEERPIIDDGPLARAATWNADQVVQVLRAQKIPTQKSYYAGSYACNQALYLALHTAAVDGCDAAIGFLHVPGRAADLDDQGERIGAALPAVFAALDREQITATIGPTARTEEPS